MRIKVAKKQLEAALSVVSSTLGSGLDMQSHYLFRSKGGAFQVLTYAGRVASLCPVEAEIEEEGDFTIEGWRLKAWLKASGDSSITFETGGKSGTVRCVVSKGAQQFPSLDPKNYPYWDDLLETAKLTGQCKAKVFKDTFDALKKFTASDEVNRPDMCVVEFQNGTFRATDKKAICFATVGGIENSGLRVHTKDIGAIVAFLSSCGDKDVEILEQDKAFFLRRADGAVFSEAKFAVNFPTFPADNPKDQFVWWVDRKELQEAIGFLSAGAPKEENKLKLDKSDSGIIFSMPTVGGGESQLTLPLITQEKAEDAPEFPSGGCGISLSHFQEILSLSKEHEIGLGMNVKGKRGYLRVVTEGDPKIVTVLGWDAS